MEVLFFSNKVLHHAMWLFIVFLTNGTDSRFCKYHICLTWTVNDQLLNLKCRVNRLLFRVEFENPSGNLVGDCIPGRDCYSYLDNVAIVQNITTNETNCLITGTIDTNLNGKWKCLHGTNTGLADVEVTVLRTKDQTCGAMFLAMVCYIGAITLYIVFLSIRPLKLNIVEGCWKMISDWHCCKVMSKKISDRISCKYDACKKLRTISVCKGVSFCVLTVCIIIIVWCISKLTDINCTTKYYALCILATTCGVVVAVLCLTKEEKTEDKLQLNVNDSSDANETKNSDEDEETEVKLQLNVIDSSEERRDANI